MDNRGQKSDTHYVIQKETECMYRNIDRSSLVVVLVHSLALCVELLALDKAGALAPV